MQYQSFISSVLEQSSAIALKSFGQVSGQTKPSDNNQVLTQTDLDIGSFIIGELEKQYPEHNIIDEEAGVIDHGSEYTWVVDPIDGTSNFANGIPTYGTMLGLLRQDVPIAGGISLPAFGEIMVAQAGQGCWLGDQRLHVSAQTELKSALVAYGIDGHPEAPELTDQETKLIGQIVLNCRNLRTTNSVFDIAMVVKGGFGAALNRTSKIWDNVAQHILTVEAGGKYTTIDGQPMIYTKPLTLINQNYTYCAANPALHQTLQSLIAGTKGRVLQS